MEKELVFGHQNPDTDAITAAMAFSYFQNQLGYETEAVALGEPNDETKYALDHFEMKAPRVVKTVSNEVNKVMLVDHNEPQQSVADLDKVTVTHLVDHHRIANFNTAQPLWITARPYGCVSTIITELFQQKHINIPAHLAGMMLSAIISDTLLLKSPTTTDHDREAVKYLAKVAGVDDYEKYGIDMLKAGTNISKKSDNDIVDGDSKTFELAGSKIRVGQVNTVDLDDVFSRQADLEKEMHNLMDANGYETFVLMVTNILNSDTQLLVVGANTDKVEAAFGKKLENKRMDLPGVVSRKKQVVPPLTKAFEG
ncbi:inorganic diphosphatase [Limosilactobacillus frumenti DSM 13145]|uniref:Probable manganese-dependent inorganic pyrophosphatase n=1 Tax=Limosilactobacillus frumenti DSM 13145 TaxID=1423746 RepID=A0A0R1PF77_9LACO|nr:manganese-dependent inorganic pyrophosphatase [Limosilactobacillus frumenti]KRL27080.1 inorganic diphosphatase [Limosilactobacillus frumenti DSM 13145]MBA2914257.1 manganese-dependent inorganic pyrophosphatase [Limosilactobacillus frumenti]QFG72552.1 manganese-dependent inorganic pyrophosphatase [Limosilactobacillus frumenti]